MANIGSGNNTHTHTQTHTQSIRCCFLGEEERGTDRNIEEGKEMKERVRKAPDFPISDTNNQLMALNVSFSVTSHHTTSHHGINSFFLFPISMLLVSETI